MGNVIDPDQYGFVDFVYGKFMWRITWGEVVAMQKVLRAETISQWGRCLTWIGSRVAQGRIAAGTALLATFLSVSGQSLAATISTATFEYSTRSAWSELIEAESVATTKSGTFSIFNVAPGPWNSGVWLFSVGSYAQVTFSVAAPQLLVQFESDSNDGVADFIVDGVSVGTLDTYNLGFVQVVIGGLTNTAHTLRVLAAGLHPGSTFADDIAIDAFGAVAPSAVPLPTALPLFATGLGALGLLGWRKKRKKAAAIAA